MINTSEFNKNMSKNPQNSPMKMSLRTNSMSISLRYILWITEIAKGMFLSTLNTLKWQNFNIKAYPQKKEFQLIFIFFYQWVFPEGYCLYDENLNVVNEQGETIKTAVQKSTTKNKKNVWDQIQEEYNKLHHFVMTDQDYTKRYCTSLIVDVKLLKNL